LRYWLPWGEYDPLLIDVARKLVKPGMTVWDVGANVGLFSFAAAHLSRTQVLAIEPDPFLAHLITRTANPYVSVLAAAVSDKIGIAHLHIAKRGRASNFVGNGRGEAGGERCTQSVPTVTLDSLLQDFPAPDLVKIDIEGMEHVALRGAMALLKRRPVLFAEVAEQNRLPMERMLSGYRFLFTNMQPAPHVPFNLIAVPN